MKGHLLKPRQVLRNKTLEPGDIQRLILLSESPNTRSSNFIFSALGRISLIVQCDSIANCY